MGILYIVATPIGNLEDVTIRSLAVLRNVRLIAAEDTRKTSIILNKYEIRTPVTSFYEFSNDSKINYLLSELKKGDIALVSEAGTPCICDPGYKLVAAAIDNGFRIVPIPGASALITAICASGFSADEYIFLGFLPRQKNKRIEKQK